LEVGAPGPAERRRRSNNYCKIADLFFNVFDYTKQAVSQISPGRCRGSASFGFSGLADGVLNHLPRLLDALTLLLARKKSPKSAHRGGPRFRLRAPLGGKYHQIPGPIKRYGFGLIRRIWS
jgi:hypothetical protein